jgi:TRAP-type C4-dicarboxylate transport system permease large subunit
MDREERKGGGKEGKMSVSIVMSRQECVALILTPLPLVPPLGVKKGFALIAGIALTAFCQSVAQQTPPTHLHLFAACLVALSTYLHAKHNDAWYAERAAKKGK